MSREQALARLQEIVAGIDHTETDSDNGWWETSGGGDFGAGKRRELEQLIQSLTTETNSDTAVAMGNYEDQEALYKRQAAALNRAEIRMPEPSELSDPMAISEFINDVLKSCREALFNEIFQSKERD